MWFLESLFLELFKLFLSSSCGRDCVLSSTFKSTLSHTKELTVMNFQYGEHKKENKFDGMNRHHAISAVRDRLCPS